MNQDQAWKRLRSLLRGQPLGVLATAASGSVHATLVAFVVTDDLNQIIFATSRATRKFRLLEKNPRAALLVDDRSNEVSDFRDACAATAHGNAMEVEPDKLHELRKRYADKHPYLEGFVRAPSCALMSIAVERYDLVGNFQEVYTLRTGDEPPAPD
jgi:nitroimidazol reductase NimA-like FMN-containing flavoprotein (pyridoxamine 5'-phosphate oxidase superfamily)